MKIILARHGNTFNPGEPAVWVGSRNDLPLVEAGITQAKILAASLKKAALLPAAVYCGPLQRAHVYAQIVLAELGLALQPIIDERLNEIDYGAWTGLTNEQIRTKFGAHALEAWEKQSEWPTTANWQGSAQILTEQIQSFSTAIVTHHKNDDTILIISSNGRLRYFLDLVPGAFKQHIDAQIFKVATGNICQLTHIPQQWQLNFWNQTPPVGLKIGPL